MKEIKTIQEIVTETKRKIQPLDWGKDEDLIEQFDIQHKKRKNIVKDVLTNWTPSTNNDILLFFECLRTEFPEIETTSGSLNVIFKIPKKLVKYLPSPESYTRARRSLNRLNIGLPTNKSVLIKRSKREKTLREYFKSHP